MRWLYFTWGSYPEEVTLRHNVRGPSIVVYRWTKNDYFAKAFNPYPLYRVINVANNTSVENT